MTRIMRHPGLPRTLTYFPRFIRKSTPFHFYQCSSLDDKLNYHPFDKEGIFTKYLSISLNSFEAEPFFPKGKTASTQKVLLPVDRNIGQFPECPENPVTLAPWNWHLHFRPEMDPAHR